MRKRIWKCALVVCALLTVLPLAAYAEAELKVETLDSGIRIQRTPYGNEEAKVNLEMNADQRGCAACHSVEDELKEAGHSHVYLGFYQSGETMDQRDCYVCHASNGYAGSLQSLMHESHQGSEAFAAAGGSCESCHYVDDQGNYLNWDFVKHDVMKGFTDIPAEQMKVNLGWNQSEVTAVENMMEVQTKTIEYDFDNVIIPEDVRDSYKLSFTGDIANPCELSINEMIEKFGTETRMITGQCVLNGAGRALIHNGMMTGIPLTKVMEDLQLSDAVKGATISGSDGYTRTLFVSDLVAEDALLVFEINGEPITAAQGAPLAIWSNHMQMGVNIRDLKEIQFNGGEMAWSFYGGWAPDASGGMVNKPNIGVLTAHSGQIFEAGNPVHLEGFAYAHEDPVINIEFSFDHGQTWVQMPTENTTSEVWVYWEMDIQDLEPGSYLMKLRATAKEKETGLEYMNYEIPEFMFNVQ